MQRKTASVGLLLLFLTFFSGCAVEVSAARYNEQQQCFAEDEVVGSRMSRGCDGEVVLRRGPDGAYWRFNNGCDLDGYERVDANSQRLRDIKFAPNCDSPGAMTSGDAGQMTDGNG